MIIGCREDITSDVNNVHQLDSKSADYLEEHRNLFHFSPQSNWMNDPNGMVYLDGEYHLFYQYYPDSTVWGPMHWGHAVSTDLVHWEHLPIALYPDSLGYIFSGSAVIDRDNTAGFGANAMIAIYTYHDMVAEQSGTSSTYQYQAIAYSTDRGRTFTKYEGNPVVPNPGIKDFRDPKVIWDEEHNQWLMIFAAHDHVKLYASANLKEWKHLSDWGAEYGVHDGVWECPDIFPMVVSNTGKTKWVIIQSLNPGAPNGGSGTQYFVGDFNGTHFQLDPSFAKEVAGGEAVWLDYGTDNYAGVTWADIPASDGRKLFLGWMSNWQYAQVVPTIKWRSAMTIPRTLELYQENESYRLRSLPVEELASLISQTDIIPSKNITRELLLENTEVLHRLDVTLEKDGVEMIEILISNEQNEFVVIGFDNARKEYFIDRTHAGKASFNEGFATRQRAPIDYHLETIEITLYIDKAAIELFADKGRTVMTAIVFPSSPYNKVEIVSPNREVRILSGSLSKLKSIWK